MILRHAPFPFLLDVHGPGFGLAARCVGFASFVLHSLRFAFHGFVLRCITLICLVLHCFALLRFALFCIALLGNLEPGDQATMPKELKVWGRPGIPGSEGAEGAGRGNWIQGTFSTEPPILVHE